MSKRFSEIACKIGFLFLLLLTIELRVGATPPSPIYALRYEADGFNQITNTGFHTITISISRDKRLINDSLTKITVEIETIGNLQITSPTRFALNENQGEPVSFPLTMLIPDNDTCGMKVTLTCGEVQEKHEHYFVSENGNAKFFRLHPRGLNKIQRGDPNHPENQRHENKEWTPLGKKSFEIDSIPSEGQPHRYKASDEELAALQQETLEEQRSRLDSLPLPSGNDWVQSKQVGDTLFTRSSDNQTWRPSPMVFKPRDTSKIRLQMEESIHIVLDLSEPGKYIEVQRLVDSLQPMDSTGYYHGWIKRKHTEDLKKLNIRTKDYPFYPGPIHPKKKVH